MAKSVDPDETLQNTASDLGLHCLQRPICPDRVITVDNIFLFFTNNWF